MSQSPRKGANNSTVGVVTVTVTVKPGSTKGPLVEAGADGALTVYVRERAIEGKATEAVRKLLAAHLGVPKSSVELVSGAASRVKRLFKLKRAMPGQGVGVSLT